MDLKVVNNWVGHHTDRKEYRARVFGLFSGPFRGRPDSVGFSVRRGMGGRPGEGGGGALLARSSSKQVSGIGWSV